MSVRLLALALAFALACGPTAQPAKDELRVISLSPALTRIVLALGAVDALVGVDRYSQRLDGLEEKPSLGGLFTPDLERAVELRPTLILAVDSAQQRGFLQQMAARGVRVETFAGRDLCDVLESFERVGRLVGAPEKGRALAADVRGELERMEREAPDDPPSVAVVIETEPLYVVGGGSFVDDLIRAAGAANAFGDLAAPYPQVSLEVLAERAPDVLLDTTFDAAEIETGGEARAYWARFAWAGRVEVLPQGILTLPGPDLVEAAQLLRERVQP